MATPEDKYILQNDPVWTAPSKTCNLEFRNILFKDSDNQKTMAHINTLNGAPGVNLSGFQVLSEACVGKDQDAEPGNDKGKVYYMNTLRFRLNNHGGFNLSHKDKEYGIYMTDVKVSIISLTKLVTLLNTQPESFIGSTTIGSDQGGSVGGNIGVFGKAGQGTGSANWSWSQSYSRNIPDITVQGVGVDNNPVWDFKVNNLPRIHGSSGVDRKITAPPLISTGTFEPLVFWTWAIPFNAFKEQLKKELKFYVTIEASYGYRHIKHNKDHEDIKVPALPISVGKNGYELGLRSDDNYFTMNRPQEIKGKI